MNILQIVLATMVAFFSIFSIGFFSGWKFMLAGLKAAIEETDADDLKSMSL
jgi:hypothetical protein